MNEMHYISIVKISHDKVMVFRETMSALHWSTAHLTY